MGLKKKIGGVVFMVAWSCSVLSHDTYGQHDHSAFEVIEEVQDCVRWDDADMPDLATGDYDMICERSPLAKTPWWKGIILRAYGFWLAQYTYWATLISQSCERIEKTASRFALYRVTRRLWSSSLAKRARRCSGGQDGRQHSV